MNSVSQLPHPLSSAASYACSYQHCPCDFEDYSFGEYMTGSKDQIVSLPIVDIPLFFVIGDPESSGLQFVYISYAVNDFVRNDDRFRQDHTHLGCPPQSSFYTPFDVGHCGNISEVANHELVTIEDLSPECDTYSSVVSRHGYQTVPIANNKGESDAKSAHHAAFENLDLIFGRRLEAAKGVEHQPPHNTTDTAPGESAADEISPTTKDIPHSATVAT